jgi:hypothetical protein
VFAVLGLLFVMTACSESDVLNVSPEQGDFFTLNATYKGITYEVPCKLEDGILIFMDKEFSDLYQNEISKLPNSATLSVSENNVEYFENLDELLSAKQMRIVETDQNQSKVEIRVATSGQSGSVILWDDVNYEDRSLVFDIGYVDWWSIPHLSNYQNFNDKTSSLKVFNYISSSSTITDAYGYTYPGSDLRVTFVGYENNNYSGNVLVCFCAPGATHQDNRLANIGWNDKITAIRVFLTSMNNGHGSFDNVTTGTQGYPSPSTSHPAHN